MSCYIESGFNSSTNIIDFTNFTLPNDVIYNKCS